MVTTKSYDCMNRLLSISSKPQAAGSLPIGAAYEYNAVNQRTGLTSPDGTYWVYTYDALGQVTGGMKYWSDGTRVPGEQFGYAYDTIGNRTNTITCETKFLNFIERLGSFTAELFIDSFYVSRFRDSMRNGLMNPPPHQ
jgi:YD repeat-containing protein